MIPVILTSAVWYAIPKGIEYLTTDCETEPQSKIEHIRTKLFGCKCVLGNLARANAFTKFAYKALQIPYARMWVAVLITPGIKKALPFKSPKDIFLQVAICYSLFSSKYFLKRFIKSSEGIKWITSPWGIKILNTGVGLDIIKNSLSEDHWRTDSFGQMMAVLEMRLNPLDAARFLRAKGKENLLSIVERVKCYKSDAEVNGLLSIIREKYPERFGIVDEDPLEHLPQRAREILSSLSNFAENLSILDGIHLDRIFSRDLFSRSFSILEYITAMPRYLFTSLSQSQDEQYERLLPKLPDYPEDIYDTDPILNKIQCPLLFRPIRSAVVDPTNQQTIYDSWALDAYLQHSRISPITKKEICTTFDPESDRGSKYDTILRYRKACLRLRKLKEPEEFTANLKQVFLEVSQLERPSHVKQASEQVRDFFKEGLLSVYDTKDLEYDDWTRDLARKTNAPDQAPYDYDLCKGQHNRMLSSRDRYTNFGVRKWIRLPDEILEPDDFDQFGNRKPGNRFEPTIENFDQYRFIEEEVRREIQKIKESQEELIQFFS